MRPARAGVLTLALALAALATLAPPAAQAARPIALGFLDGNYTGAPELRDPWLASTVAAGADIVRIDIGWPVAGGPVRPAGFDARNPGDPHYDFTRADASIRAATAAGLDVLVSFTGAPPWVDGPGRPASVTPGTWKPSPPALRDYGAALARRYSGSFPDPEDAGRSLPRVRAFQVWNEPNLQKYLSPQWRAGRPFAPAHYRRMVSAFYDGVRSVGRDIRVVTAGTAPFGDDDVRAGRIHPVRFWREALCVRRTTRGRLRRASGCAGGRARFDVMSHHPYSVGSPRRTALHRDDVSIPDLGKLSGVLRAAERLGTVGPAGRRHGLWVTEVSYDSSPPDPQGVPAALHARYLQETLYLLWKAGVEVVTWFQVRDSLPQPSFAATNQSGVFLRDGRPKPAARAFRFPLVAERAGRGALRVWGRSPVAGTVAVERGSGSAWTVVHSVRVRRGETFLVRVRGGRGTRLRARVGSERSAAWRTG